MVEFWPGSTAEGNFEQVQAELENLKELPFLTLDEVPRLPSAIKYFLIWILDKKAVTSEHTASYFQVTQSEAQQLLDAFSDFRFLERLPICGEPRYRVHLEPRRFRFSRPFLRSLLGA